MKQRCLYCEDPTAKPSPALAHLIKDSKPSLIHEKMLTIKEGRVSYYATPRMLTGNVCDLTDVHIDTNRLNHFCEENSIIGWFPTSAKNNKNIDEAMKFLIEKILELPSESQQPSEHISLSMSVKKPQFDDSFEMDKETLKPKDQCCS